MPNHDPPNGAQATRDTHLGRGDGLRLAATLAGDPSLPPVVLLHGGGQTRRSWKSGQTALAAAGYHVVSYDARGHGQSDWDMAGDYGADALVGDLRAVVASLEQPPVVVGASLGGLTALLAAAEAPKIPACALVLVDVTPVLDNDGVQRVKDFMSANPAGFESVEAAADAIDRFTPGRPRSSNLSGLRRSLREVAGRFFWHWDPRFLTPEIRKFERARLETAARKVDIPVLLVRGGSSDVATAAEMAAFGGMFRQREYIVIEGAGHMIAGDRNDAFNAAILEFLERLGLAASPPRLTPEGRR